MELPYSGLALLVSLALFLWVAGYFAYLYWGGSLDEEWPRYSIAVTLVWVVAVASAATATHAVDLLQLSELQPSRWWSSDLVPTFLRWLVVGLLFFLGHDFVVLRSRLRSRRR
jgi:hypothetical protein